MNSRASRCACKIPASTSSMPEEDELAPLVPGSPEVVGTVMVVAGTSGVDAVAVVVAASTVDAETSTVGAATSVTVVHPAVATNVAQRMNERGCGLSVRMQTMVTVPPLPVVGSGCRLRDGPRDEFAASGSSRRTRSAGARDDQ